MSKFCIELEDVTLPDVIAAVVEAWYEAQNVDIANLKYAPGQAIQRKPPCGNRERYEDGWVFYKYIPGGKKICICQRERFNFVHLKPQYLVDDPHGIMGSAQAREHGFAYCMIPSIRPDPNGI